MISSDGIVATAVASHAMGPQTRQRSSPIDVDATVTRDTEHVERYLRNNIRFALAFAGHTCIA